jgi:hypothetical protein
MSSRTSSVTTPPAAITASSDASTSSSCISPASSFTQILIGRGVISMSPGFLAGVLAWDSVGAGASASPSSFSIFLL